MWLCCVVLCCVCVPLVKCCVVYAVLCVSCAVCVVCVCVSLSVCLVCPSVSACLCVSALDLYFCVVYVRVNTLYFLLHTLTIQFLNLGFELELYSRHELPYIYWYLHYLYGYKEQNAQLLQQLEIEIKEGEEQRAYVRVRMCAFVSVCAICLSVYV